eukprot:scaffold1236_cov138-Skeletonema_marinoi.AAC.10
MTGQLVPILIAYILHKFDSMDKNVEDYGLGAPSPLLCPLSSLFWTGDKSPADVRSLPAGCDQALKTARRTLRSLRSLPAGCDCSDRCDRLQNGAGQSPPLICLYCYYLGSAAIASSLQKARIISSLSILRAYSCCVAVVRFHPQFGCVFFGDFEQNLTPTLHPSFYYIFLQY